MSKLMSCGYCCMVLSLWAIVQLTLMGIFFKIESVTLIHDAEEHDPKDHADFIKKTQQNYSKIAINCWLTAVVYAITLLLSLGCIKSAKKKSAKASSGDDDEAICQPAQPVQPVQKKNRWKKDSKHD